MLELYPIFRGNYSTFKLRVHSTPYTCHSKGCRIIRGAEFLEEVQYENLLHKNR